MCLCLCLFSGRCHHLSSTSGRLPPHLLLVLDLLMAPSPRRETLWAVAAEVSLASPKPRSASVVGSLYRTPLVPLQ